MKIGVFDSGVGGLSVANAIEKSFPYHEVIYKNDTKNVPYGKREPAELINLCAPIIQSLIDDGCEIIVIACNTVSTTIIDQLRARFIDVPFISVEPLIKLASETTRTGKVIVCATPTTLASRRYGELLDLYGAGVDVIEPDCSDWSYLIEQQAIEEHHISNSLEPALAEGADVIVLGCTHYHWIEREINKLAKGRAIVLQPEPFVIQELKQVIQQLR